MAFALQLCGGLSRLVLRNNACHVVRLVALALYFVNRTHLITCPTHREEVRYICSDEKSLLQSTYFYVIFNESSIKNNIKVSKF